MSHSPTTRAIALYASEALAQNDPMHFLKRFAPLHKRWHTTSLRNNLGFFLFHWYDVAAMKKCHADQIWPGSVQPFTLADWNNFNWPYSLNNIVTAGDIDSMAGFSANIEGWHNEAHMAVETVTGENMMDPLTNVYLRNFWRLHFFINDRFLNAINAFDGNGTVEKQVARLIKKYHTRLGDI